MVWWLINLYVLNMTTITFFRYTVSKYDGKLLNWFKYNQIFKCYAVLYEVVMFSDEKKLNIYEYFNSLCSKFTSNF